MIPFELHSQPHDFLSFLVVAHELLNWLDLRLLAHESCHQPQIVLFDLPLLVFSRHLPDRQKLLLYCERLAAISYQVRAQAVRLVVLVVRSRAPQRCLDAPRRR